MRRVSGGRPSGVLRARDDDWERSAAVVLPMEHGMPYVGYMILTASPQDLGARGDAR